MAKDYICSLLVVEKQPLNKLGMVKCTLYAKSDPGRWGESGTSSDVVAPSVAIVPCSPVCVQLSTPRGAHTQFIRVMPI